MKKVYILFTLYLLITACSSSRQTSTATDVVASAQTPTPAPTATQASAQTPTLPPTLTPTMTPSPTPTFTLVPTSTPSPTLTPPPSPTAAQPSPTPPIPSSTPSTPAAESDTSFTDAAKASAQQLAEVLAHARSARRNVTYCAVNGVELKLDLFFPKSTTAVTPLVIFIHGGGWSRGDKTSRQGVTDFPALLDAGFTVATLDYRLAPEYKFPAMIQDVKCAVRSMRANANLYKIDPNKIGVWGASAGGHLVNLLGTTDSSAGYDVGEFLDQSSRVQAVVDMFGPEDLTTDFSKSYADLRGSVFDGFDLARASPATHITPDDPPFLILQGDIDRIVPLSQSQEFYNKLTAAGVTTQLVVVHGGPHGLTAPNQSPSRAQLTTLIVQFFAQHLK